MARILVIDDEDDVRFALVTLLEDAGHNVVEAVDGAEGFAQVLEHSPDIVLLDITMPGMDGFEILKRLKTDESTDDIPVIMVTDKGQKEDLALARFLGARDYINKPWATNEVEMRVEWALSASGDS